MMRTYDSYKDSGIEWIGEIPRHWECVKYKSLGSKYTENISVDKFDGKEVIHYSIPNVQNYGKGVIEDGSNIDSSKILLKGGELIISKLNPRKSCVSIVESNLDLLVVGSGEFVTLNPTSDKSNVSFLYYYLKSKQLTEFLDSCVESVTRSHQRVNPDVIYNSLVPLPPLTEQEQIVSYLDEKSSLIDEMVEKKKRKIELLKEYRTSLINTVVTKGLNPDVPMKDSGIEWIGEIPRHWKLKKLKYISEIIPSNVDKHIYEDEKQVELCNYTDVYKNDKIDSNTILSKGSCNSSEYDKYHVKLHDVIITKDSESPDDIGIPCLISEQLENVICGYHLTILRPTSIDGRYLFRYLLSNFTKSYFCVSSNGMTRYGLGKSSIENLFTTLPPLSEQEQIVSYLDEKTSEIDKTIELENKKIELLKEYRQSLISNVVTGKIKVTIQ